MTGPELRRRREALGLTQAQLAEHVRLAGALSSRTTAIGEAERTAVPRPGGRVEQYAKAVASALARLEAERAPGGVPSRTAAQSSAERLAYGAQLRTGRDRAGLTQFDLGTRCASIIGCKPSYAVRHIGHIETGLRTAGPAWRAAIASALAEGPAARDAAQPVEPTPAVAPVVATPSPEPETVDVPSMWRTLPAEVQAGIVIGRLYERGLARGGAR